MDRFNSTEDAPEWAKGAFDDGYLARLMNCSRSECPSPDVIGQWSSRSWMAGWFDADMTLLAEQSETRKP